MTPLRLAAFATENKGGNPAGVLISDKLPSVEDMQRIAAEVGYSETAFASNEGEPWRVRYFAPESEVPFCGHATIALGAALAQENGDGTFNLKLNDAEITVAGKKEADGFSAALKSPRTNSEPASQKLTTAALELFGLSREDLDDRLEPTFARAGATHLLLFLKSRDQLSQMAYDFEQGKTLMREEGLVTIALIWIESPTRFHVRNAFASGGVFEDPATGAAAAAFSGYLRDAGWPHGGNITIIQGEDMGSKSVIHAKISDGAGEPIEVSGNVRTMTE